MVFSGVPRERGSEGESVEWAAAAFKGKGGGRDLS